MKMHLMDIRRWLALFLLGLVCLSVSAQLDHSQSCKFLGSITTNGSVNPKGIQFDHYWNQLTPENESKWGVIEAQRDVMNWSACDSCYQYCKEHHIPFKFHVLVWGSQYPHWMDTLSVDEQRKEVEEWFDAVHDRYPDLKYIDVVNEALVGHAPAPYKEALGGDGVTGYDWVVNAFKMARERWPHAVLIYNDYNTFLWQKTQFISLVQTLLKAGAPVDAVGCQGHDLNDMSGADFKLALEEIHSQTGLPVFISEYDICKADDEQQLQRIEEQFPVMWEADYVAGVTFWGYVFGQTWICDGNVAGASGLIRDGKARPALTWLCKYLQTKEALHAVSPFDKRTVSYHTSAAETVCLPIFVNSNYN